MMMAVRYSGPSAIGARLLIGLAALISANTAAAAEAPIPQAPVSVGPPVLVPPEAEAPYQVATESDQKVRWLDTAVFTEISPLTVPDVAVKLPEDQQE